MSLAVDVEHGFSGFRLAARFAAAGGVTALYGRSGSGKTTVANIVAGLLRPERGRVSLGEEVLTDTAARIFVPVHRRRIGYVFQEGRLFPHLSVRRNLLYGRWFAGRAKGDGGLAAIVEMLGIGALLERRTAALSGGEKQRVALGRALLSAPRLLLMDEPLAALDAERKAEILPYLERLRDETRIPILYVSHAVEEIIRLADTVVVLAEGRVAAVGPALEVLNRPDLAAGAEAGTVLEAEVAAGPRADGLMRLATPAGDFLVADRGLAAGTRTRLRIRPEDVIVAAAAPHGLSALNILAGRVARVEPAGAAAADVVLDCGGSALRARVTLRSVGALGLRPGVPVHAIVKSVALDPGHGP